MKQQIHVFKKVEEARSFAEELEAKGWTTKIDEVEGVVIYDQGDPEDASLLYDARSKRWVVLATKGS